MAGTRDFLKQNTSAAHRSLDETLLVTALVGGTLSPQFYRDMLLVYQAFFSCQEGQMRKAHPGIVADLGSFRFEKSDWLAEDLHKLGTQPPIAVVEELSLPTDLAGLAGCLYVVEGSTLGGMHLSRSGHGFPMNAGRFFQGYGVETMPAWKTFIEWLEVQIPDDAGHLRAAATANETFSWFQRQFTSMAAQMPIQHA